MSCAATIDRDSTDTPTQVNLEENGHLRTKRMSNHVIQQVPLAVGARGPYHEFPWRARQNKDIDRRMTPKQTLETQHITIPLPLQAIWVWNDNRISLAQQRYRQPLLTRDIHTLGGTRLCHFDRAHT